MKRPPTPAPPRFPRRAWTTAEDDRLRADYPSLGGPALSAELARSLQSIYLRAAALGLSRSPAAFLASIAALHAAGLSDAEIAGRLGCERHRVGKHRRALGLPSNRRHNYQRDRVRRATARQCAAAGVASLGAVRAVAFRRYAASSGWPADLAPREVHILDALAARGPLTRPEVARAIGMEWRGSRRSLKSNTPGGSYLAGLVRRGLVVRLGRLATGAGSGKSLNLYSLAIDAERSPSHA